MSHEFFDSAVSPREESAGRLYSGSTYERLPRRDPPVRAHEISFRGTPVQIIIEGCATVPAWVVAVAAEIERLASLPEKWDSYSARTLQMHAAYHGLVLLGKVMTEDTPVPGVHATAEGGIQFDWSSQRMAVEVEVTPEGKTFALVEDLSARSEWEDEVTDDLQPLREAVALV